MKIFTFQRSRRKRASLQLSINAIVVLVMAMVVLGLGLSFIRNLIGQGEKKLSRVISMNEINNPASATDPLKVDHNVKIKSGGTAPVYVSFYNTATGPKNISINGSGTNGNLKCFGTNNSIALNISSIVTTVESGSSQAFKVIITDKSSPSGKYTCSLEAVDESDSVIATDSFILNVE